MASLISWLKFAGARLVTGLPVATGRAYFYRAGTAGATAAGIYADAEETEPLSQPVALDAAGRATVYCNELAEIVVQTSAGVEVARALVGNGVDAALVVAGWGAGTAGLETITLAIETSIGATARYLEGGTNSLARNVHDVLHDRITPQDFGATGDGVVNDTVPLQRAIDRAIATKLPLYLPPGTYRITAALTASGRISIYGDGMYDSVIQSATKAFTGLTVVGSGSFLRDFGVTVPREGDTYDTALAISGDQVRVERVYAQGGQGIISTASATTLANCWVRFNCPNTGAQVGYGISVQENSLVENCSVLADAGSATHLTTGIRIYSASSESTSMAIGGKVQGAYVGGDGFFLRTEFDTCVTGLKCSGPLHGGAFCRMTSCTTPFSVSGGTYPISFHNHFDGTEQYIDSETNYQTDATATPTFLAQAQAKTQIFKATYAGTCTTVDVNCSSDLEWKIGQPTKIIIQAGASTNIGLGLTFGGWIAVDSTPALGGASAMRASADFVWTGTLLQQVSAWDIQTGAVF